jgi:signal transduction histidine kinase
VEVLVGLHSQEFLPGDQGAVASTEAGPVHLEREIVRADGSSVTIECDMVSLGDGRTLVIARDLSARREAEANRVRAERSAASQALATSIGTDLHDALSFVKSSLELSAELANERVPLDPAVAATTVALEVIEEFLAVSPQIYGGNVVPPPLTDLRPVIEEVIITARETLDDRVTVEWDAPTQPIYVRATSAEIALISSALLAYAVGSVNESLQAGGDVCDGRILVRTEVSESPDSPRLSEARITVEDNGGQIAPDVRERMFEPLGDSIQRASHRLGLGTTHARALSLGGTLAVSRRASGGSTVTVRLPGQDRIASPRARLRVPYCVPRTRGRGGTHDGNDSNGTWCD